MAQVTTIPTTEAEWAKLYDEEMSHYHGLYGTALWYPESPRGDVQVGDVGLLIDGEFRRIFNALSHERHDWNRRGVPYDFEQHRIDNSYIQVPTTVDEDILHSPGISVTDKQ